MVVPNYDEDEIIEDYEEVSPDDSQAGARKVASAQGGPVKKPSREVKPSDKVRPPTSANPRPSTQMNPSLKPRKEAAAAAPAADSGEAPEPGSPEELAAAHASKGKITAGQAKLIWIICIAVCVLGLGAVAVHYFIFRDPNAGQPLPNSAKANRPNLLPSNNRPEKSQHEKNADAFVSAVTGRVAYMNRSKAWDFFLIGQFQFGRAVEKARDLKRKDAPVTEQETAWADAIKAWYEARYRINVFILVNRDDSLRDFLTADMNDRASILALTDRDYADIKIQNYHAALLKLGRYTDDIKKFQTDVIKNNIMVGNMFTSDQWKPHWAAERKKWEDSNPDREDAEPWIDPSDLEYCKGPDFLEGEKTGIQKAEEEAK
ncbi:MAG: hypothetical protein KF754_03545 [Planctomycetes bacterium]|nr:hypothetical protein [Planctomycetota bacterium]